MPVPTYALPSIGELNAIADPKVRDALSQLLAYLTGGLTAENLDPSLLARAAFVGEVRMSGKDTPPTGWLDCRGQAVSRTTYALLYQALGIKYGAGDGSTTFNLPDFSETFPAGSKVGGLQAGEGTRTGKGGAVSVKLLGTESGVAAHTHPTQENPHTHGGVTLNADASHRHSGDQGALYGANDQGLGGVFAASGGGGVVSVMWRVTTDLQPATHAHNLNISGANTGVSVAASAVAPAAVAHENRPPFVTMNFVIYAGA